MAALEEAILRDAALRRRVAEETAEVAAVIQALAPCALPAGLPERLAEAVTAPTPGGATARAPRRAARARRRVVGRVAALALLAALAVIAELAPNLDRPQRRPAGGPVATASGSPGTIPPRAGTAARTAHGAASDLLATGELPELRRSPDGTVVVRIVEGDIDGDGDLTVADLELLGIYLDRGERVAEGGAAFCPAACDLDADGELTPADYTLTANRVLGHSEHTTSFALAYTPGAIPCEIYCP